MVRYLKIKNGIECQLKVQKGVMTMKRCRKIKTKKLVSTRKILKGLGIYSY